jgi:DNA-binding transcriptional ArsR family regulator
LTPPQSDLEVVVDPERAAALMHPPRRRVLEALGEPGSAATLARSLSLPRQRVNYHLRELAERGLAERGLVELQEERVNGSCTERIYARASRTYTISDAALGPLAGAPEAVLDRFSAAYQIALAARTVGELGKLQAGAAAADQKLASLALDTEVRFSSPRHAFSEELSALVADLIGRYHDERAEKGRTYRLHLGAYPKPKAP